MRIIPIIEARNRVISLTAEHQTLNSLKTHDRWKWRLATFLQAIPESRRRQRWRLIARLAELSTEAVPGQHGHRTHRPRGAAAEGVARHEH